MSYFKIGVTDKNILKWWNQIAPVEMDQVVPSSGTRSPKKQIGGGRWTCLWLMLQWFLSHV